MAAPFTLDDLQPHYRRYLGRDAGPADYETHRGNVGGLEGVIGAIVNSQEARDFSNRPPTAQSPAAPPAAETPTNAGTLGGRPAEGRRGTFNNLNLDAPGQVSPSAFRGFNDDRALSGGDPNSIKDTFRRFMGGQNFNLAGQSKDQLDAWMTGLIPQAREYGLNILDVIGDQILIETAERGPEWVDYVQNAGGDDPAFQWLTQQEFGNSDQGGFPDAFKSLTAQPGGGDILSALLMDGGLAGSDLLRRIQAELQKLLTGQPVTTPTLPPPVPGGGGGEGNPLEPLF